MSVFRKKPVEIEAYCFNQKRENFRPDWFQDAVTARVIDTYPDHAIIHTLEGAMRADLGDWIIRGVKGEMYPCKPDIFELTYEAVPDDTLYYELPGGVRFPVGVPRGATPYGETEGTTYVTITEIGSSDD